MAFLIFALSLVLLVAGLAGAYMSLDLLPTGPGLLYAFGGAVAACMAILAFAIGVMIRRIDALTELARRQPGLAYGVAEAAPAGPAYTALTADEAPMGEEAEAQNGQAEEGGETTTEEAEEPVNENRSGHLPTLGEIEHAIETPEAPPSLIGRYSSGGANYMIFADGSIEAETQEGTFKFASMGDFKQYLADRKYGSR
jgi:hypothetical protein